MISFAALQQQCGVANLPPFRDSRNDPGIVSIPNDSGLQSLVPAYTFNCTGRVTEWKACMEPGGGGERYYIQFQVWRPTNVTGCYELVGSNQPLRQLRTNSTLPGVTFSNELLQPEGRCVVLPVSDSDQIEFQHRDVVGYYVERYGGNGDLLDTGRIQMISSDNIATYYTTLMPPNNPRSSYTIQPASALDCGFQNLQNGDSDGDSDGGSDDTPIDTSSYELTQSTSAAPVISLSIGNVFATI